MTQQALKNIPKTEGEAKRQKGPVPLNAIFLVLGLLAALLAYYAPVIIDVLTGPSN